jgi:hypothetical protein
MYNIERFPMKKKTSLGLGLKYNPKKGVSCYKKTGEAIAIVE